MCALSFRQLLALAGLSGYFLLSVSGLPTYMVLLPLGLGVIALEAARDDDSFGFMPADGMASLALALFLLSYLLSAALAYNVAASLNALAGLIPALFVLYIVANVSARGIPAVAMCLVVLFVAASMAVVYMFFAAGGGRPDQVFEVHRTPALVVPNDMVVAATLLPVPVALGLCCKGAVPRILLALCVATVLVACWLVQSRLVWLVIALMLLAQIFVRLTILRALPLVVIAGVLIVFLDWYMGLGALDALLLLRVENARLSVWLAGLTGGMDFPLLGTGPGNFEIAYRLGLSRLDFPSWVLVEGRMVPWAHSLYVEALVERGLLGLVSLLLLLALVGKRLYLGWVSAGRGFGSLQYALLISYGLFLLAGVFETTLQRIWVANLQFLFLGLVWGMPQRPH